MSVSSLPKTVDFYGRNFLITPDVLVPRPETEQLIDLVLSLAGKPYLPGMRPSDRQLPKSPVILDVGTGSGCIAVTLALEIPHAQIFASDCSIDALSVARQNAENFALELSFFESNLLHHLSFIPKTMPEPSFTPENTSNIQKSPNSASKFFKNPDFVPKSLKSPKLDTTTPRENHKKLPRLKNTVPTPDLIVANLPYVDKNWSWVDQTALSSEPSLALYADEGGLALIKELIKQCRDRQIPRLVLEADPSQHAAISDFADHHNYHLERIMGYALSLKRLND